MARTFLDEVRLTAVPSAAGNYLTLSSNGTISQRTQAQVKSELGITPLEDRNISAGDGLTGGGSLAADRSFAVDDTVVRTSGNQTIWGTKTFGNELVMSSNNIRSHNNTSALNLFGSDSFNNGAGLWLRGGSHPSEPGVGSLRSNGSAVAYWDSGGFHVNNSSNVVLTSGNQTISGIKTFSNGIVVNTSADVPLEVNSSSSTAAIMRVQGGNSAAGFTAIRMQKTTPSTSNNYADIRLNNDGELTFSVGSSSATLNNLAFSAVDKGTDATRGLMLDSASNVFNSTDTGTLVVSGGSASNAGASVVLHGGSHTSTPNRGQLRYGTSNAAWWDSDGFFSNNLRTTSNGSVTDVAYGRADNLGLYFGSNTVHLAAGGVAAFSASNTAITSSRENFIFTTGSTVVMRKNDTASTVVLSGGNNANNGAAIVMRGSTYTGEAATGYLRSNGTNRITWDTTGVTVHGTLRIPVI